MKKHLTFSSLMWYIKVTKRKDESNVLTSSPFLETPATTFKNQSEHQHKGLTSEDAPQKRTNIR